MIYEALLFEASSISHPQPDISPDSFTQFVFDKADFNVNTLDGLHTFHSMGVIQCVTSRSDVCLTNKINRLKNLPSAESMGNFRQITFKTFQPTNNEGLKNVIFEYIVNFSTVLEYVISQLHLLWIFGKFMNIPFIPGWSAFMAEITKNEPFSQTSILPLQFVNSPPSNYDIIYTVLNFASKKCTTMNQNTCFVTFDQPLYIKARDVVEKTLMFLNVIVRLGDFHLLISFMGAIRYIMVGSRLKELFSIIYAPNTVEKIWGKKKKFNFKICKYFIMYYNIFLFYSIVQ